MYLKRLELQGFKSFADKTVLDFGRGVTTVVGPNGSGKSNISDAIRWVMGEMSAKTLRGANMQDVIFAGTDSRKPVNFAQVSLVLDNSDKMFPIDFDEIIVTRRVYRSGESSYQINNAECRLKDIHELFMDTGLGKDGYSMIGQGNVAKILSTKAEDRRSFFEEAAGVSKYKHRKDEAMRKLTSVNENLIRINDITGELEARIGPLAAQSKKARRYLELYDEYKALDVSMCIINLEKNTELLEEAKKAYDSVMGEIEDLKSKETDIEAKRDELYLKSSKKDEEQAKKNNELIENEAKSMACSNDIAIAQNNIKNNTVSSERINKEIVLSEKKISELKERIKAVKEELENDEKEKNTLMGSFSSIQDENTAAFDQLDKCRKEIDALRMLLSEKLSEESSVSAKISGIEALRSSVISRREDVLNELKNHGAGVENIKKEIESNQTIIKETEKKQLEMKTRVDSQNERLQKLRSAYDKLSASLAEGELAFNSKSSKKRMLEAMENDYEGFSGSVKAVMTASELKNCSIFGTVSGLINVEKEYVTAIETALAGAMQNIVVETEEDAKSAISYLKEKHAGRATFLPVSSVKARSFENLKEVSKCKGFIGTADSLISFDKKYDGIMKNLLGRVAVFDNIDNAVETAKQFSYRFKIVTLSGDVINAGGSISGGSINKTSGFLSRAAEIKSLGSEMSALSAKLHEIKKELSETEADIETANKNLSSLMPIIREYENRILLAKNTLDHLNNSLLSSDSSEKTLADELKKIEDQLSKTADEIAESINLSTSLKRESEKIKNDIAEKENTQNILSEEKDKKAQELVDATLRLKDIENEAENKHALLRSLYDLISENEAMISDKNDELLKIQEHNSELENAIEEKKEEIEKINEMSDIIKKEIEDIESQKQDIVSGLKDIATDNKDITDRLILLQQELSKAESKQIKYENDNENIITRLWDEYELTRSSAMEIKTEIEDIPAAKGRVTELKNKIRSLGHVNLESIDEYVETKERFDFLTAQKADLEKSQDNLSKVIASMQELMEELFKKQFAEINRAFSRVFNELFGGGRGRLFLSDPEDIMESGIEIEVQLPGKGLQNINLYSGGEKSFIAIALLFAILDVKPTAFCFLDEIDAALDDVNVSRFATYLKNYLNQTQFIVITHRRGTMESANIMYGVTMQEKGVSKLLALNIDDVDDDLVK